MRLLALALLAAPPAAAQTCTPNATQQAAQQTLALQAKLLAASTPQMETDVPPAIKPSLHDFKQALLRTVDTALLCNNPAPSQLQSGLVALLHANQPDKPFVPAPPGIRPDDNAPETGDYGGSLKIDVKPVGGQPDLYSIQVSYDVECGDDNMLLLYRRSAQGYRRELAWFNPDLNSTGDAFGDLYAWSLVPGPGGRQLFAGAHGTPWCTSRFSDFKVDLLSLAAPGQPQRLLQHENYFYSRTDDAPNLFHATADGFQLRVSADSLDFNNLFTRPRVYRFRTTGGALTRIQPIADNARDFVDAWIQLPWAVSKQWAASPALESFRNRYDYNLNKETPSVAYGPTFACGSNRYQVQMKPADGDPGTTYYLQVNRSPQAFTVLSASQQPDSSCHGPDLIPVKK